MKFIFALVLILFTGSCIAQNNFIVKYYDSLWLPTIKEKASFFTEFEKIDTLYKCTSYYLPSKKLYATSTYADTLFKKGVGILNRFFESGKLKDSTNFSNGEKFSYYESGSVLLAITSNEKDGSSTLNHYYENGKLLAHLVFTEIGEKVETTVNEGFEEDGKAITNFIYQKEAEFPGGRKGWSQYLQNNLKVNIPRRNKAPEGRYSVIISFIISKTGTTEEIVAENDPGYGTKEEAIRVIKKGPKWEPAIQFSKPVAYRARQQITFLVE